MKNKKLLSISASSLMLLNAGLAPVTALAEEHKAEKTEVTGEHSTELKNSLAEDPLAKITNGDTQSATQPTSEAKGTTVSSSDVEPANAQTEESSTTVASSNDGTSSTQTKDSATIASDSKRSSDGSIQTKGIDIIASGDAKAESSTGRELLIHDKKTEGVLSIDLKVRSWLSAGINDTTYYQIKLPEEFRGLVEDPNFSDYLSAKAHIRSELFTFVSDREEIPHSSIQVDSSTNTVIVKIPKFSCVALYMMADLHLGIDLGKFVTDTGTRVPDSLDGKYDFSTAWTKNKDILNWTAIGSKAAKCYLESDKLDPAFGTNPPVITASDRRIALGQPFTGAFAMNGVSAYDEEDGDLTKDVIMVTPSVNSNVVGTYPVTYKVTDSHGLFATKTINVTVGENKAPVINAEDKTIYKGDAFNPLADVTASDEEDGDLTSKIDIKSNNVDVNVPGTYYITYAVTDSGGLTTTKDIKVTVRDTAGEVTPNDYTVGSTLITGTYDGEVSSLRLYVDDNPISDTPTMIDGKFTFQVNKDLINENSNVVVVAYNKDNKELDRKTVKVIGEQVSGTITPANYSMGDQYITGTYTGDVKLARVYVDGTPLAWGGEFEDGQFTYYVGNHIQSSNSNVTINAYTKDGKLLQSNVRVTINAPKEQGTITPNTYTIGESVITGTYTGDVRKAHLYINGKSSKWGGTFKKDGTFEFYVGNLINNKDDNVTMDACTEKDKILQQNVPVTINAPKEQGTITPNTYTIGESVITGTYTGDVRKAHLYINGKSSKWGGTFKKDGTFEFYVGNLINNKDDSVTMDACTEKDKILQQNVRVTINAPQKQGTIKPNTYTIGEKTITGTYTGDVRKAHLFINGKPSTWGGTFKEDGTFEFYVGNNLIKKGDVVTMDACTANDQVLQAKVPVQITKPQQQGTITPEKYTLGDTYITGTYTGDVTRAKLIVNGKNISTGGQFANGSFSYYVGKSIGNKEDKAILIAYAQNGEKLDEEQIVIN